MSERVQRCKSLYFQFTCKAVCKFVLRVRKYSNTGQLLSFHTSAYGNGEYSSIDSICITSCRIIRHVIIINEIPYTYPDM